MMYYACFKNNTFLAVKIWSMITAYTVLSIVYPVGSPSHQSIEDVLKDHRTCYINASDDASCHLNVVVCRRAIWKDNLHCFN